MCLHKVVVVISMDSIFVFLKFILRAAGRGNVKLNIEDPKILLRHNRHLRMPIHINKLKEVDFCFLFVCFFVCLFLRTHVRLGCYILCVENTYCSSLPEQCISVRGIALQYISIQYLYYCQYVNITD